MGDARGRSEVLQELNRQPSFLALGANGHLLHLSLNRRGRWGTTDDFITTFLHFFSVLHWPLGLGELQACPFSDVVFPPLPPSALSSLPFHFALQDGFGQTR